LCILDQKKYLALIPIRPFSLLSKKNRDDQQNVRLKAPWLICQILFETSNFSEIFNNFFLSFRILLEFFLNFFWIPKFFSRILYRTLKAVIKYFLSSKIFQEFSLNCFTTPQFSSNFSKFFSDPKIFQEFFLSSKISSKKIFQEFFFNF